MSKRNPIEIYRRAFPKPFVNDDPFPPVHGGCRVHGHTELGDELDFASGLYRVARDVGGMHVDTENSILVASIAVADAAGGYAVRRLYLAYEPWYWFLLRAEWGTFGLWDLPELKLLPADQAFDAARALIPDKECGRFIADWYCGNLIDGTDAAARAWAEASLSGADLKATLAAIEHRRKPGIPVSKKAVDRALANIRRRPTPN